MFHHSIHIRAFEAETRHTAFAGDFEYNSVWTNVLGDDHAHSSVLEWVLNMCELFEKLSGERKSLLDTRRIR